jgi:hypothetical protein
VSRRIAASATRESTVVFANATVNIDAAAIRRGVFIDS